MRYIDAFNHFSPKRYFDALVESPAGQKDIGKRVRGIPALYDLELRLKVVDQFPDYTQILSLGLPMVEERLVDGVEAAVAAAQEIGFPVVVKSGIAGAHKTETGGVALGLPDEDAVRAAAERSPSRPQYPRTSALTSRPPRSSAAAPWP